jgi:hypothetical protein
MKRSVVVLLAVLFAASTSLADVTVERFMKTGGIAGLGASESTSITKITGLKKRETMKTTMTGGLGAFAARFAGDLGSDSVTDVAADKITSFDHKRKSYSESTISQTRKALEQGGRPAKEEKSDVRIVRNEVTVTETGKTKVISGFPCREYLVVWLVETEDLQTKERAVTTMTMDLWNTDETSATRALAKEEGEFTAAYLKKLGFDQTQEEWGKLGMGMVAGLFGGDEKRMKKDVAELQKKMAKVKGFSIATGIKWEATSPNGGTTQAAGDLEAEAAEAEAAGDAEGAAAARGIGAFLGGFGKKQPAAKGSSSKPAAKQEKAGQGGSNVIFDSYTEIRSISASSLPGADFQVPAGYTPAK